MPNIELVNDRKSLKKFIEYPYKKYKGHPVWVPPLLISEWEAFDRKKNPFFEHAEADLFIATDNDQVVGRIAMIEDRLYNDFFKDKAALFAHFEAENENIAKLLFAKAEEWAKKRNLNVVRGPSKVGSNDMVGFLVENFDDPPVILMPYNPPEYANYAQNFGYVKSDDNFAWIMFSKDGLPDRVGKIAQRVKRNLSVNIRPLDFKNFDQEVETIRGIYNRAWEGLWSFVPWTEHEIKHMANEMKLVADRKTSMIAEINGRPVAFSVMVGDVNQILRGLNGRLLPFGIFKLLLQKPKRGRLIILGIEPEYRNRGLDALLYAESFWRGTKHFEGAEFGATLESNTAINEGMKALGAKPYKRYRVFEKKL